MVIKQPKKPTLWVQNEPVYDIWSPWETSPYLARHLIDPIRAVMGFWAQPHVAIADRAEMSGLLAGEYIAVNRMLYTLDVVAVKFCIKHQLPASASVPLKFPFRCKGCGSRLSSLPCIQCWSGPDDDPHV